MILYILQYTELWATLLPIIVWLIRKPGTLLKPVKVYLAVVLCLYLCIFAAYFNIISNNHFFYTLVSLCRLICFTWFFLGLQLYPNTKIIWVVCGIAVVLVMLNFLFLENFLEAFSSHTFSLEAFILLIFCIQYFLKKLRSDEVTLQFDAALYIITGLAIYEAVCFPMFLFYNTLISSNELYAAQVWNIVQNIAYIVFCILIARAFYGSPRYSVN